MGGSSTSIDFRAPRRLAKGCRRRGMLTVELVMTLPILLAVLVATVLFGQLLMSEQAIQAAASAGAREASLPGATAARVQAVVEQAVDGWRFAADIAPVEIEINGAPAAGSDLQNADTGDRISVRVKVAATSAVPDMLNVFGISIAGEEIAATYIMRRE
ncbi:MAG: TadE/TadG family type IV pilus assembly protein [Pirellulales bacterium]